MEAEFLNNMAEKKSLIQKAKTPKSCYDCRSFDHVEKVWKYKRGKCDSTCPLSLI